MRLIERYRYAQPAFREDRPPILQVLGEMDYDVRTDCLRLSIETLDCATGNRTRRVQQLSAKDLTSAGYVDTVLEYFERHIKELAAAAPGEGRAKG